VSQADWDRVQYYSRKVKSFVFLGTPYEYSPVHHSTYIRLAQLLQSTSLFPSLRHFKFNINQYFDGDITHIFLFLSPLLNSLEFINIHGIEHTIVGPFLGVLFSQMRRIILRDGQMLADNLKSSIVHLKQLRYLELSNSVIMSDFTLWEVLGTLPSLEHLTLDAIDPASHPAHAPANSNSQSGGPKYFEALETLSVTGSFFFIQHLLGFIDSPCLTTIRAYPVVDLPDHHEPDHDNHFTPFMTIIASKWSQSLKNLVIDSDDSNPSSTVQQWQPYAISKCLMLLTVLHEMQTFHLAWKMKNMDNHDVRRLVMSWPKLRTLKLHLDHTAKFLSTLKIIAENCPELCYLQIPLNHDTSTSVIPFLDTSSKSLHHNLEVLDLLIVDSERVRPTTITPTSYREWLQCQIEVAKVLDFIFPYLTRIKVQPHDNETWLGIRSLIELRQDARRVK
jgi:hypothetical protein